MDNKNKQDKTILNSPLGAGGRLAVKICGMKFPSNIVEVAALNPDFMGFIFYPKSPRYAESLDVDVLSKIPRRILKIGVFVNETEDEILEKVKKYSLQGVQLHGSESEEFCYGLKMAGLIVLKAFPVVVASDFSITEHYEGACDFFLFDTKTPDHGGSGRKFDWSLLDEYKGETSFLLSGGIAIEDVDAISSIKHPKFAGIDLNSKFEVSPGLKDVELLKQFTKEIKSNSSSSEKPEMSNDI